MPLDCRFEELDPATRDHLLAVRRAGGRGAPGVFVPVPDPTPVWALVAGVFVAVIALAVASESRKGPAATAALQAAGVLAGGWLVLYAFRRWLNSGNAVHPGRFLYFDPLHVYQVRGETVRVTPLAGVAEITARSGPAVAFRFDRGNTVGVPVPTTKQAERVETYYAAMEKLERERAEPWAAVSAAELGAGAVYAERWGNLPQGTGDIKLDFDEVPVEPKRATRAGWGLTGLALVPAAAAGLFAAFYAVNQADRDEAAFGEARAHGAPGLRAYLADDRNAEHRDEAKQLLAAAYDEPVRKLLAAPPGKAPDLRRGLVELVESLRTADVPAVSIRVTGSTAGEVLRREVADSLARTVGPDRIAFASAPDGVPAMLEIACAIAPGGNEESATVTLRLSPTADPSAAATVGPVAAADDHGPLRQAILIELAGGFVPAPPADAGDF